MLRDRVVLEKWEVSRNGRPSPTEKMEIIRKSEGRRQVKGHLMIDFSDVFLREPNPKKGEHNLILTNKHMHEIADQIWAYQFRSRERR